MHLLRISYVSVTLADGILRALNISTHVTLSTALGGWDCTNFIDEISEAKRNEVISQDHAAGIRTATDMQTCAL